MDKKKLTEYLIYGVIIGSILFSRSSGPTLESYHTSNEPTKQGGVKYIEIATPKGKFNVYTKRIGNNPRIKVLLLHGGPGGDHQFFLPLENYLPKEGIEFIYYDQLGSGKSDHPTDLSLWDLPRFVEEVEQVRLALGLDSSNFYLLGHSWGGILASEYALKYQKNLKGLIISNMMMSIPDYVKYANEVLAPQMPPEVLKQIRAYEARKDYGNPKYMELVMEHYYTAHLYHAPLKEWPIIIPRLFEGINQQVYIHMQGPSEFGVPPEATLYSWDRKADLPKITVPTLVVGATHDTMDPKHMEWVSKQVKNGSYRQMSGGHAAMWDDPDNYGQALIWFLKRSH